MTRQWLVAVVALAWSAVSVADGPGIRVYAAPRKPTAESIRKFFVGSKVGSTVFATDGTVTWEVMGVPTSRCRRPGSSKVTASGISFSCDAETESGGFAGVPVTRRADGTYTESYEVHLISDDLVVFTLTRARSPPSRTVLLVAEQCTRDTEAALTVCAQGAGDSDSFVDMPLVQLLPGSPDRALYDDLKKLLAATRSFDAPGLFVEGSQAKKERAATEVFYVGDKNKAVADKVAALLAPVTGPVETKPWPGAWDYDVVVVAGKAKAGKP